MSNLVKVIVSSLILSACTPQPQKFIPQEQIYLVDGKKLEQKVSETPTTNTLISPCPKNMANIEGKFCIDRWEATIVDKKTGKPASPNYITERKLANSQYHKFSNSEVDEEKLRKYVQRISNYFSKREKTLSAKRLEEMYNLMEAMPRRGAEKNSQFEPIAVSLPNEKPASYVTRYIAERACTNAKKRLCMADEWYQACVGPGGPKPYMAKVGKTMKKVFPTAYPYGSKYKAGKCNIDLLEGKMWPPGILGRKNNWEMMDPRIANLFGLDAKLMIAETGSFGECKSGYDVYDLVGNVHEIVADTRLIGKLNRVTYMGSHFARGRKVKGKIQSCEEVTPGHWFGYIDYSLGFRCCAEINKEVPMSSLIKFKSDVVISL